MLLNIFDSIGNFFKSLFETFDGLIQFFTFLQTNWIGLTAGAVVALIIIVLIGVVLKGMPNGWLCALLIFICCSVGLSISAIFTSQKKPIDSGIIDKTPEQTLTDINNDINKNWPNTNGGFNFEQIQSSKNDENCPTTDDVVLKVNCQDYGDYVCFYYFDGTQYQNIVFVKNINGLVLDGILNHYGTFRQETRWWLFSSSIVYTNRSDWKWISETDKKPYYFERKSVWHAISILNPHVWSDYVSMSSSADDYRFLQNDLTYCYHSWEAKHTAKQLGDELIAINTKNFAKISNAELVQFETVEQNEMANYKILNSFFNFLYDQVKTSDFNKNKIIDVSSLMTVPIPENLQKNYPLSDELKNNPEFAGKEYFAVYNCNIAIDCTFEKGEAQMGKTRGTDTFYTDKDNIDRTDHDDYEKGKDFSTLALRFNNIGTDDLTGLDLAQTHVVLQIKGLNSDFEKTIKIDSLEKLNQLTTCLIEQSQSYSWQIQSGEVIFEGYSGTFTTATSSNYALTFNYKYLQKRVMAQIGLNPIGTIDKTKIDLDTYPVKIVLSNETKTYQFVFDSNEKLDKKLPLLMELGEYNWTILSDQLIFAKNSGTLTLTTNDNVMIFNYALGQNSDLVITTTTKYIGVASPYKQMIYLRIEDEAVDKLQAVLGDSASEIKLAIYNAEGKQVMGGLWHDLALNKGSLTLYHNFSAAILTEGVYSCQMLVTSKTSALTLTTKIATLNIKNSSAGNTDGLNCSFIVN